MNQIRLIAWWEYITRIRSKWFWIGTILLPIIILGLTILPTLLLKGESDEVIIVGIVNLTDSELMSENQQDPDREGGTIIYRLMDLEDAKKSLEDKNNAGYAVLDKNFLQNWEIKYFTNNTAAFQTIKKIESYFSALLLERTFKRLKIYEKDVKELQKRVKAQVIDPEKGEINTGFSIAVSFGSMYLLFLAIFINAQILMRSVITDRQNKVIEILVSSVSPQRIMAGKIFGLGMFAFTQILVYFAMALIYSQYKDIDIFSNINIPIFVVFFILGFLLYATMYAGIGSLFTSEQEAQQLMGVFSIIGVIPIVFTVKIINDPNSTSALVMQYIPLFTPFIVLVRTGVMSVPLWELVLAGIVLIVTIIGFIYIFGKIFRTAILMTGKRPSLKEIVRWFKVT